MRHDTSPIQLVTEIFNKKGAFNQQIQIFIKIQKGDFNNETCNSKR